MIMSQKSVFREAASPEMTSQSFPVSCFSSRGFIPPGSENTEKKNRYQIYIFCYTYQYIMEILSSKQKKIGRLQLNLVSLYLFQLPYLTFFFTLSMLLMSDICMGY